MALSMPTYPGFKRSNFYLKRNTQTFTSPFNGSVQRVVMPGDKWIATYTLPAMNKNNALNWMNFFNRLRGAVNTFYAFDPEGKMPRGLASGSPLVAGGSQTGYTLTTDGWPTSTLILRYGDYVSFGGELKMISSDITSDGSGNATLAFEPAIRNSPSDNAAITYQNTNVEMIILDEEICSWETTENGIYVEKTFTAVEAFF